MSVRSDCHEYLQETGFRLIEHPNPAHADFEYEKPEHGTLRIELMDIEGGEETMEVPGSLMVSIRRRSAHTPDKPPHITGPYTITEVAQLKFLVENTRMWRLWHLADRMAAQGDK